MKKSALPALVLACLLLLPGCGSAPTEATTEPPVTTEPVTTAPPTTAATRPASTAAPDAPLSGSTIATAEAWNAFARRMNEDPSLYADGVDITIAGQLDFSGMTFVKLGGFCGTLSAARRGDGFYNIQSAEGPPLEGVWIYYGELFELPEDAAYGDAQSRMDYGVQADTSGGLFGAWVDRLTLNGLTFSGIDAPDLPWLLGDSIGALSLSGVSIEDCRLEIGRSLLCGNAGSLWADGLYISDSSLHGDTWGAGLTRDVHGDLSLTSLSMSHVAVDIAPDLGGSGVALGDYSLTVSNVGGTAALDGLSFYQCRVDGAWSYLLLSSDQRVSLCSQVQVDNCQLLALPWSQTVWGDFTSDILFGRIGESPTHTEEITLRGCIFKPIHSKAFYEALGWQLDGCMAMQAEW